jgi:DNA polymerase III alpha subunit
MAEATRLGFSIKPPHVNHSKRHFTLSYEDMDAPNQIRTGGVRMATLWVGLGQVRNLRRQAIRAIIKERETRPFTSLADLIRRVSLQNKELRHLVQCGALDGLGRSRAALLAQVDTAVRAGAAQQMSFAFAPVDAPAESARQHLEWERHILGQAITVHPLDVIEQPAPGITPIEELTAAGEPGERIVSILGIRLPGWTGGRGFFVGDQKSYITVRGDKADYAPETWQPLLIHGRLSRDQWGTQWLQADTIREIH